MSQEEKRGWSFLFLPRALLAFVICAAALLLCGTVLYAANAASLSTLGYGSSVISFFAALAAGAAAAFDEKKGRALIGIVTGLALSALLLLLGFLIKGRLQGSAVLSVVSFTLTGCLIGALLPVKRKRGARFRPRKKKS